jgi:dihydroorotate dehydrogenase (NAD+) catalytic subunit
MIKLGQRQIDFLVSSGALGFTGLGYFWEQPLRWVGLIDPTAFSVVVAKTVTAAQTVGNLSWWHPWSCVRLLPGCNTVNAIGLSNPSVFCWTVDYYPQAVKHRINLAPSVKVDTLEEARYVASTLSHLDVPFLEVNFSCPNLYDTKVFDPAPLLDVLVMAGHHLVVKLALRQINNWFVSRCYPVCAAFHAINSVPWTRVFGDKLSPLERYQHGQRGGVSGPVIRDLAIDAVRRLSKMTDRPVIGGGGIWNVDDVEAFAEAGAGAFSIGSLFLHRPWAPNRLVRHWRKNQQKYVAKIIEEPSHGNGE